MTNQTQKPNRLYMVYIAYRYCQQDLTLSIQLEAPSPKDAVKTVITNNNLLFDTITPVKDDVTNLDDIKPYAQVWLLGGVTDRQTFYRLGCKPVKRKKK